MLVFNAAGEVFLQKRSMAKDMSPGLWDSSCSGHLDAGEAYDNAAWRELEEELGVRLAAPPERWFRVNAGEETGWEFCWVYRLLHEGPFVLHPGEIERGEWRRLRAVSEAVRQRPDDYCPAFKLIWTSACARLDLDNT